MCVLNFYVSWIPPSAPDFVLFPPILCFPQKFKINFKNTNKLSVRYFSFTQQNQHQQRDSQIGLELRFNSVRIIKQGKLHFNRSPRAQILEFEWESITMVKEVELNVEDKVKQHLSDVLLNFYFFESDIIRTCQIKCQKYI